MEEPQFLASVGISVSSAQRNMRRDLQRYGMDVPPDGLMQSAAVLLMDAYDAIPDPPVSPAAPLSSAVSARAPADGVDRISLLPDSLIRNVVSRLPAKDAARTAALATRWRGLWRSVPLALVDAHILPACVPADSIMPRGEDVLLRRRRRGVPRPGGAPRPLPLRPPLPLPHGVAPGRHRALAGDPRRQGRPRAHLSQPPVADRPPSPPRALRLHLRHPPAPRLLQGPQHRRAPAHHTLPPLPRACPRNFRHPGTRPPLPDRPEPRPGGPHHGLRCVQVTMSEVDITVVDAPRLERLLMWELISPVTPGPGGRWPRIKIGHAPNLCMLGHCQPRFELEIGNTILKVGTKMSPSTMVPSVKILALEVGFEVHNEVKMMPRFLKCFPNVERLHVFSLDDDPSGKVDPKFWKKEAGCIDCVQRHVKKFVFQEFQGKRSELAFLKFIAERAQVLEKMVVMVASKCFSSADAINAKLKPLTSAMASRDCKLIVFKSPFPDGYAGSPAWDSKIASDFSCSDPFDFVTSNAELYSGASVLQHSSTL